MSKNYDNIAYLRLRYEISEAEDFLKNLLENYQDVLAKLLEAEDRISELEDEVEKLNERVYELQNQD